MRSTILIFVFAYFASNCTLAQGFTFIGEKSYPSTAGYHLNSNSDKEDIGDLAVTFAKDSDQALIIVSSKLTGSVKIANKLIIYLDDGSVISCSDRGINDNVDEVAVSAFYLTKGELIKLRNSNIQTIRFEIVCPICGAINYWEGVYSASNKGQSRIDFMEIVTDFYNL